MSLPSVVRSDREGTNPIAPRLAIAGIFGVVVFGILVLRLWALTVLGGAEYAARAEQNQSRQIPVEAPRGSILDRNGKLIVTNRPARAVVLDLQDVPEEQLDDVIARLSTVLSIPEARIRQRVEAAPEGSVEPVVIAPDVERRAVVLYLAEHASEFPGVDVTDRFTRSYPKDSVAAHILGQVGAVDPDDLESNQTLEPYDHVGKSGIERQYDEYLRGRNGYRAVEVDAAGVRKGEGRGLPYIPGRNLRLTIDLELQRVGERSLKASIARARRTKDGRGAKGGAIVALDPKSGEVLALASAPDFDPNIFVTSGNDDAIRALMRDKRQPQFNRALAGSYPAGSVYKPIAAIAALEEGFVTPNQLLGCPPSMTIGKTKFRNNTDLSRGSIDLATALETSCNTYFYVLGLNFFNDPGSPLQTWSRAFGLGRASGIDLPGEGEGRVPTPAWKSKHFTGFEKIWTSGDSVNLSIGQGNLEVTPIQMTAAYAAIANGGTLHTPRIGKSVDEPSGREALTLESIAPQTIDLDPGDLAAVQEGLRRVNDGPNGTATSVFGSFPVPTAGKTGTVEKLGESDLAWYCGYAPADNPTIAACAFVEGGGHGGTSAAPVVLEMYRSWFNSDGGSVASSGAQD